MFTTLKYGYKKQVSLAVFLCLYLNATYFKCIWEQTTVWFVNFYVVCRKCLPFLISIVQFLKAKYEQLQNLQYTWYWSKCPKCEWYKIDSHKKSIEYYLAVVVVVHYIEMSYYGRHNDIKYHA